MILITGCTGYIGKPLTIELLKCGFKVRGLVLPSEEEKARELVASGMEQWIGDLLIPETLHGISRDINIIYHLAGLHSSIDKMERLYVHGAKSLMDSLENSSIEAFYAASNGAVYGDYGDKLLTEDMATKPRHPFGVISLRVERLILEEYKSRQLPCAIFRIGEVYGHGECNPLRKISHGNFSMLGDGSNFTSKIHIDDVVSILKCSMGKLKIGGVYNVTDDMPVTQKEFYDEAAKLAGASPPRWISVDTMNERIKLSIHGLRTLSIRMSNLLVKDALNYKFKFPTFREGLKYLK